MIYTGLDFPDMPRKHYGLIYADPAWKHTTWSEKGVTRRSPSHHYPTMTLDQIRGLPVREVAAKDCHLMMWTTQPHLEQSFDIMRSWGFRYSSVFKIWLKLNPKSADEAFLQMHHFAKGTGFTTRKNFEILLLGRKGSPKRLYRNEPDFIIAARREHSRKPDALYPALERYAAGPYLELNARTARPGWDQWGNEVEKFPIAAPKVSFGERQGPPAPDPPTPMFPAHIAS